MCDDPHWKEYSGLEECKLRDPHYHVRKLCELLRDETAQKMIHRHVILIDGYLRTSPDGFLMSDLSYLMIVLESLAERLNKVREYRPALKQILERCRLPPVVEKASDVLRYAAELEQYFTLLGYLVVLCQDEELQLLVLETLKCLLTRFLHRGPPGRVTTQRCLIAMGESLLPRTLAELIEVVSPVLLPHILSITLIAVNASPAACRKMVCARAVDAVLFRMDPQFPTRDLYAPPSAADLVIRLSRQHEMLMAQCCSVLWALLGALKAGRSDLAQGCLCASANPSQAALWCLGFMFRYETLRDNTLRRNELAGLITLAISVLPDLLIVESNIAGDLILLAVGSETGMLDTWAQGVVFSPSVEDVHFKRMLLLTICHLVHLPACVKLILGSSLMPGLLELVVQGPDGWLPRVTWTPAQAVKLLKYSLRTLSFLAFNPALQQPFVDHRGPDRLLQLIRWYPEHQFDDRLLQTLLRTLAKILSTEQSELVEEFRRLGAEETLIGFCLHVSSTCVLTTPKQRVLTLALLVLEILLRNCEPRQRTCGQGALQLVRECCDRVVHPRPDDPCIDHRMLITLVDFLWEAIVWCPENQAHFVSQGGVFALLDTMQCSGSVVVKCIFLSALADLVEGGACVAHLVTWRDVGLRGVGDVAERGLGYAQVLARIWREEEMRRRVRRNADGVMEDIERPLMGEDQWYHTYFHKKDPRVSPAIADIFGSVRPKIYAILQVLKQRHAEKVERAQSYYHMDYQPVSMHDKITLELASNFLALKMGEVWGEVSMDVTTLGLKPIGAVGEVISMMTARQMHWASSIQECQRGAMLAARKKGEAEEKEFYEEQNTARLASTLEAMRELDFIARTSDQEFCLASKERQMKQVDGSLEWPNDLNICRHRTYLPYNNVTVLTGQAMHIISVGKKDTNFEMTEPDSISCESTVSGVLESP